MSKFYLAYIDFETQGALKSASGKFDLLSDSPICVDFNGFPMVLGSSIAGVLRHLAGDRYNSDFENKYFGDDDRESKIIISNALLLDSQNRVCEELENDFGDCFSSSPKSDSFLQQLKINPKRERNALNEHGVCKDGAKFDSSVVFSGTRFRFSIELGFDETDSNLQSDFLKILDLLFLDSFRLGGCATSGFGAIKIREIKYKLCDLKNTNGASLNDDFIDFTKYEPKKLENNNWDCYELALNAESSVIFGAGFGDFGNNGADSIGVREKVVDCENKKLIEKILIPASSIKGALKARVQFYYNKIKGNFIENESQNADISELFGNGDENNKAKGKILISDVFIEPNNKTKVLNHNRIDRFSGGVEAGALFNERVDLDLGFTFKILVKKEINKDLIKAFECALFDIANGHLGLGGKSSIGHGYFSGKISKNGEILNAIAKGA